jgi:N-acetylglucosamine-6-sulfatase
MSKREIKATTGLYRSKLEAANNQLENTIIIFTSDNGYLYGEHRVITKTWPYEESIRVPLIIRHPDYLNTGASSQLVSNIDLAPTIVETAGASATIPMDGLSLLPIFQGTTLPRESLWFESFFSLSRYGRQIQNTYTAERDSEFIYIEHLSTGEREIYDIINDPFQLNNLW